jgi:hypothetical protein
MRMRCWLAKSRDESRDALLTFSTLLTTGRDSDIGAFEQRGTTKTASLARSSSRANSSTAVSRSTVSCRVDLQRHASPAGTCSFLRVHRSAVVQGPWNRRTSASDGFQF